jgi:hypothetical protein
MTAQGGPLINISIAGRTFPVAQDSDPPRDIGGLQNDVEMNGDKTSRVVSEVMPGKIGPVAIVIDDANDDQQFIQTIKDEAQKVDCSAEYITGAIYYAQMAITDATEFAPKASTMEVTLKGDQLTKQ